MLLGVEPRRQRMEAGRGGQERRLGERRQTSELQRVLTEERPGEQNGHFPARGQRPMERPAQPPAEPALAPSEGRPQDSPGPQQPPSSTPPEGQAGGPSLGFEEWWHRCFRGFAASGAGDPVQDLRRLSELCHLWLRPDLHTKEEIMDQLVLEQFTICMPEDLQALVVENGLKRCRDLEDLLGSRSRPQQWSVIVSRGQKFLVRNPDALMAEARAGESDAAVALSSEGPPSVSEERPQSSEATQQPQSPLEAERPGHQGEEVLREPVPGEADLRGPGEAPVEGGAEAPAQRSPEPQPPQGPADSVQQPRDGSGRKLRARTRPPARAGQGEVLAGDPQDALMPRHSKRRRSDEGQFPGRAAVNSVVPPSAAPPVGPAGTQAEGGAQHACEVCEKSFRYSSQLVIHQRTHTGERPFKCRDCSKGFMQASDLRVHQRIHTGERPFECALCYKQFTHESTLQGHLRVHTREKPYECADCGKPFSHKGNLNVHLRIHRQAKPYSCDVCGRAFRQLGTYKRHRKTHTEAPPARPPSQAFALVHGEGAHFPQVGTEAGFPASACDAAAACEQGAAGGWEPVS